MSQQAGHQQCAVSRKICYSKSDAERAAAHLRTLGEDDATAPIGVYRCVDCTRYHVGHNKYGRHDA